MEHTRHISIGQEFLSRGVEVTEVHHAITRRLEESEARMLATDLHPVTHRERVGATLIALGTLVAGRSVSVHLCQGTERPPGTRPGLAISQ